MARVLHVGALSAERWVVSIEDEASPVSEHPTRGEAETSARAYAQSFGYPDIIVHGKDGEEERIAIQDPDPQPGYPGAAKGEAAG